mgnify:CR=1 FL=1
MNIDREPRIKVTIRATMRAGEPRMDVYIRDISPRGMMMMAAVPPPRGTYIEVIGVGQTIVGRVTWSKDQRFGVRMGDRLDLAATVFGGATLASGQGLASGASTRLVAAVPKEKREDPAANRAFGKILQFTVIVAFAVALSVAIALAMYDTLASSLGRVSTHLGGSPQRK